MPSRNSSENRRSPILQKMKIEEVRTPEDAREFFEIYFKGRDYWLRRDINGIKLRGGEIRTERLYNQLRRKYKTIWEEEAKKANHRF